MTVVISSGAANVSGINVLIRNVFDSGTITASSEVTGKEALNAIDRATYNVWRPTAVPATLAIDAGTAVSCDGAAIVAHDGYVLGSTFAIQHSADGVSWTTAASCSPLTSDTIFMAFPAVSARYWRILVTDAVCSIGVVMIGKRCSFTHGPLSGHTPYHHAKKSEMMSNDSITGQFLGNRVSRIGADFSVNAGVVDRDFTETNSDFLDFEAKYNAGYAFAYCGSMTDTPDDCAYCRRPNGGKEMAIAWVEGDLCSEVSFEVSAYVPI